VLRLAKYGLKFEMLPSDISVQSSKLEGFIFVISGVYDKYSRPQLKQLIEEHGGKVVGSLSLKTSFLLAGDQIGPSKKDKAAALNIPLLSEVSFIEMIS
jgi:DNA ligase (NAD+)